MTPRQPHSRFARNERCQFLQGEILADEERDGNFMKPGSLRCAKRSFFVVPCRRNPLRTLCYSFTLCSFPIKDFSYLTS